MTRQRRLLLAALSAAWVGMVLACGGVGQKQQDKPEPAKDDAPPDVTVAIDYKGFSQDMMGQDYDLLLENKSDRPATFYAVVYASNDKVNPPRRNLIPLGYPWMVLCGKQVKGDLTPQDLEQHWSETPPTWKEGAQQWSDRKAFRFDLKPREKTTFELGDMLYTTSPLEAWKDQPLAPVGYSQFRAWLFTENGKFFHEETIDVDPTPRK